jgi:hypothetical protein
MDFKEELAKIGGELVVAARCGSRLYGTATPNSDEDYVFVYRCSTKDLLMGDYKDVFEIKTNKTKNKNTALDKDFKFNELKRFIDDCLGGQTYALDLLWSPDSMMIEKSEIWNSIVAQRDKLVTNNLYPFIRYCQGQAHKYSDKGAKFKELDEVLSLCSDLKVKLLSEAIGMGIFKNRTYFSLVNKSENDVYLEGLGCSFPANRAWKDVLPVLKSKYNKYGNRVRESAEYGGVDLKAYYHAFRILWEMEDYMTNGRLEFPCSRVHHLRDIRAGKYDHKYIMDWIESEIKRVESIPNTLPAPDFKYWNKFILDVRMSNAYQESWLHHLAQGI